MGETLDKHYKKVGLFGGTFDPIHWGHIKAATAIFEKLTLDHLYFVPAYVSPFKMKIQSASDRDRLAMLKLALGGHANFSISEYELNKKETSFTIETLRHYKKLLSNDVVLYLILGSDAFEGISQWKEVKEIFAVCHLIVVSRPGYPLKSKAHDTHYSGNQVLFFQLPLLDISSTQLREKIDHGEEYSDLIPASVEQYIRTHRLYQKSNG